MKQQKNDNFQKNIENGAILLNQHNKSKNFKNIMEIKEEYYGKIISINDLQQNNFSNNQFNNMNMNMMNHNMNINFNNMNMINNNNINMNNNIQNNIQNNNNNPYLVDFNQIIVIQFISGDNRVNKGIKCLPTQKFYEVEEQLYNFYPEFRKTNNSFITNGGTVFRFQTIAENNIKDGQVIQIEQIE